MATGTRAPRKAPTKLVSAPSAAQSDEAAMETWEITTGGTVWLSITDPRSDGGYRKQKVGGKSGGSRKITISRADRKYNQDKVIDEMKSHDPFTNGLLRPTKGVDDTSEVDTSFALSNDEIVAFLGSITIEQLSEEVAQVESELFLRRLHSVALQSATVPIVNVIDDELRKRFSVTNKVQNSLSADSKGVSLSG